MYLSALMCVVTKTTDEKIYTGLLSVFILIYLCIPFHYVDETGKQRGVFNEENWSVISDDIPNAFFRVKFDGESSNVSDRVWISSLASYSRKSKKKFFL